MPQTAPALHIYTRNGGYEPEIGLHFATGTSFTDVFAESIMDTVAALFSDSLVLNRWEARQANGAYINGGTYATPGTWPSPYGDFKDAVHVNLNSGGPAKTSGFFIQGRPLNFVTEDVINGTYLALVVSTIASLISAGLRDSEGFVITNVRRITASRRKKIRLAP